MLHLSFKIIERLHRTTMAFCGLMFLVMVTSTATSVVMRYVFSYGALWLQDLSLYSFGLFAILSIPCAMATDKHVRVDIFRQNQLPETQALIDRIAIFGLLFPVFILLVCYAFGDALYSFAIREGSPQIGGLPFYFLVKAGIPLGAFLMLCQAIGLVLKRANDREASA
ncbi:MAG: TRAP transporter small permease subunit [Salaquimonas sp.]